MNKNYTVVVQPKNVSIAIGLTFIFGPFGMFYTTAIGAILMLFISFVVAVMTLGIGLLVVWPVCIIWNVIAVLIHNQRIYNGAESDDDDEDGEEDDDSDQRIECPYCAEFILPKAKICRYCGRDLPEIKPQQDIRYLCPKCNGKLKEDLSRCSHCHVELYYCTDCDAYVLENDVICRNCGGQLNEETEYNKGTQTEKNKFTELFKKTFKS